MYFTDTKLIQNHVWNAQNIPASDRISVFDMKCKVFGVFGESALKARSWLLPDTEKESSAIDQHKMSTSFTYDCIVSLCRAHCSVLIRAMVHIFSILWVIRHCSNIIYMLPGSVGGSDWTKHTRFHLNLNTIANASHSGEQCISLARRQQNCLKYKQQQINIIIFKNLNRWSKQAIDSSQYNALI